MDMDLDQLLGQLLELQDDVAQVRNELLGKWHSALKRADYLPSVKNLAAYIGFRRWDLRDIQRQLAPLALSSLGRCESHVEASLRGVIHGLRMRLGQDADPLHVAGLGAEIRDLQDQYDLNTRELLGTPPDNRQTRIMVTLPSEAASDPSLVRNLLAEGMNIARINLAHDTPDAWNAMVANLRNAEKATDRPCRILMDLAGAKLRTGALSALPQAIHIKVKRDVRGTLLQPAGVILDGARIGRASVRDGQGRRLPVRLSVDPSWLRHLNPRDSVDFVDLTGKRRTLHLEKWVGPESVMALCHSNAYVEPGTVLVHRPHKRSRKPLRCVIGPMDPPMAKLIVHKGDQLRLAGSGTLGEPASFDVFGNLETCATIPCQEDGVFAFLNPGERVFIDDGAIQAEITEVGPKHAMLRIVRTRDDGNRIRAEKGLNFPDSCLRLPPLSCKDLQDLEVVAAYADLVGFSFVQEASDIDALLKALAERTDRAIGIVAKIETQRAVSNLPEIIAQGAGQRPFGVMIARGDLAVELGYERLAEIQEELLWICEAAHVPVIWATQVLENLIKKGTPSRAEVTDAAMSMRAECVMLNKGPHILNGIKLLGNIIQRMEAHQDKKVSMLRALHW
jgi:pyruvate kinase